MARYSSDEFVDLPAKPIWWTQGAGEAHEDMIFRFFLCSACFHFSDKYNEKWKYQNGRS